MPAQETYARLSVHRWMLRDEVRNEAYRRAIAAIVKPGDVVLDVGAGTGILSIFAAQAGARRVYAVERSGIYRLAQRIIETNGCADRITVLHGDLEDIDLPEKVDVIVSEWMGSLGIDENMLAPVVIARNRWLKPGGTMIPARVTAFAAPVWLVDVEEGLTHWRSRPHGIDLSDIATMSVHESPILQSELGANDVLAPAKMLWTHDTSTCTLAEVDAHIDASLEFSASHAGKLSALATWFEAEMGDGTTLTNAIGAPDTHWGRLFLPFAHTFEVVAGMPIHVDVRCMPTARDSCGFEWSVQVGEKAREHYDTFGPRV